MLTVDGVERDVAAAAAPDTERRDFAHINPDPVKRDILIPG